MVNTCELSLNVVRTNKPKVLIGLSQKRHVVRAGSFPFSHRRQIATGEQTGPKPFHGMQVEREKSVVFPEMGKQTARGAHEAADVGGWSKRKSSHNGKDRR
jgi:hypothetical protein